MLRKFLFFIFYRNCVQEYFSNYCCVPQNSCRLKSDKKFGPEKQKNNFDKVLLYLLATIKKKKLQSQRKIVHIPIAALLQELGTKNLYVSNFKNFI